MRDRHLSLGALAVAVAASAFATWPAEAGNGWKRRGPPHAYGYGWHPPPPPWHRPPVVVVPPPVYRPPPVVVIPGYSVPYGYGRYWGYGPYGGEAEFRLRLPIR